MARTPTTFDPFNAIAEPRRRRLLETLGGNSLPVGEIARRLGWPQPMISKHLAVLKQVGLVSEQRVGRLRVYRVNAERLKPVHDWVKPFERLWEARLDRLEDLLHEVQAKEVSDDSS
jgi:DNA-binding transcriptional ArsR family regulator